MATQRAPTLAELQAQLQQANNTTAGWGANDPRGSNLQGLLNNQNRAQMLSQQINQMQTASGQSQSSDPVQKAKDEMYGLVRGAVNRVNPIDQMVLQALQERSGKDAGPYDQATRNALMTQAADTAGQVALNAKGRINGSANDPSVMAANNEADARRLQAIQQAQLGINTQANVANYDARGQALGQLGGYNQQVQGNQISNERYLSGLLQQESQYRPDNQVSQGIPTFQQYSQAAMPQPVQPAYQGYQPAQQTAPRPPQPVTQPARTVSPTAVNYQNPTQPTYTMTGSAGTMTGYNSGYGAPATGTATAPQNVPPRIIRPGPTNISYLNPYG